jgi:hypothetical protein
MGGISLKLTNNIMKELKELIENILYENGVHQSDLEEEMEVWKEGIEKVFNKIKDK